jgi:CHAD domain-containing protein
LAQAIALAARQFPRAGEDEAARVHNARKALKGAAGLARLFTGLVGPPAYGALAAIDAARKQISRARDLDVLPGVLAKIDPPARVGGALRAAIAEQRDIARRAHRESDVTGLAAELNALAAEIAAWDIEAADAAPLLAATRAAYRAARRRGEAAMATRDAGELHAFRARVVDLACQLSAFEPAWPAMMRAATRELHRLRAALGDHNDLTVLAEFARARPELTPAEADAVIALVTKRQRPLERRAARLYARLFSERPADFERRLAAYLAHPRLKPRSP